MRKIWETRNIFIDIKTNWISYSNEIFPLELTVIKTTKPTCILVLTSWICSNLYLQKKIAAFTLNNEDTEVALSYC